ncbi:MAG TPA: glycosyltransferase [Anaerolineales bacterium]|nr:glycosyltransferase [Anaerolineales bacterium]
MKISLCLLTRNEVEGCRHDVPLIERRWFDEIYAVDGQSKDGTVEYLESQGIPVHQQPRKSLNAAVWHAFDVSATEAVVLFHPKGTISPTYLPLFRTYFEQGLDLVIASRVMAGAHNEEDDQFLKPRKWFVLSLAVAAAVLFRREGNAIWDVLHGFRGMRVDAFRGLDPTPVGVSMDLEMVSRSYRKRLRRVEFPVVEVARSTGTTHFPALPTGWALLRYLLREMVRPD